MCGDWQAQVLCAACLADAAAQREAPRCRRCAIGLLPELTPQAVLDECQLCEDQPPEFDRAIAALDYALPWSPVLAQLKFREGTALAPVLARALAEAVAARPVPIDWVLPVPLSPQRLHERGYNQSWLLAQGVAQRLGLAARHDLVARTRHTQRLMRLDPEHRRAHIHGAFEVPSGLAHEVRGRDLAVVDDVMTTGATLNELSATLREAGARSVSVWVLARTPTPRPRSAPD